MVTSTLFVSFISWFFESLTQRSDRLSNGLFSVFGTHHQSTVTSQQLVQGVRQRGRDEFILRVSKAVRLVAGDPAGGRDIAQRLAAVRGSYQRGQMNKAE